jgi:hypothetical protein
MLDESVLPRNNSLSFEAILHLMYFPGLKISAMSKQKPISTSNKRVHLAP